MKEKATPGKILIVDDEKCNRAWVLAALKGWNLEIKELESGLEFHPTVRSFQPDLLLLDFKMPGKDGMVLCRELRQYDRTTNVIFFSSITEKDMLQKAYQSGFQDCLGKPSSLSELRKKIEHWLLSDTTEPLSRKRNASENSS